MDYKTQIEKLLEYLTGANTGGTEASQLSTSEWEDIFRQAGRQGVAPLLYHTMKNTRLGTQVPASLLERLQKAYHHNAFRNVRLYRELAQVIGALQADGIALPLS